MASVIFLYSLISCAQCIAMRKNKQQRHFTLCAVQVLPVDIQTSDFPITISLL